MTLTANGAAAPSPAHPPTQVLPGVDARRGQLDPDQIDQLLRAVAAWRVLEDERGNPHLAHQDVVAHLIRIFGHGRFDLISLGEELLYCEQQTDPDGIPTSTWEACYRASRRLVIHNRGGELVCVLDNSNAETVRCYGRGRALQRALTGAVSLATKRAAIALGDQFGLGLYNHGSLQPIVRETLDTLGHRRLVEPVPGDEDLDIQGSAPRQIADDTTGSGDRGAERGQAARSAALGQAHIAVTETPPDAAMDPAVRHGLLLAEAALMEAMVPGLTGRWPGRLGLSGGLETASLAELASMVAGSRRLVVVPLRRRRAHEAADHYLSVPAAVTAPLPDLLGVPVAEVLGSRHGYAADPRGDTGACLLCGSDRDADPHTAAPV